MLMGLIGMLLYLLTLIALQVLGNAEKMKLLPPDEAQPIKEQKYLSNGNSNGVNESQVIKTNKSTDKMKDNGMVKETWYKLINIF